MERILENDFLKIKVADAGAELVSVYDKKREEERIWCGDAAVWGRHAPVLFPFEGKVIGGKYIYKGAEYAMTTQHGFARDRDFDLVSADDKSITHVLRSDEKSLAIYPFSFELYITHVLAENTVTVLWKVVNTDTAEEMLYGIGGHPGFNFPTGQKATDCSMRFFGDEKGDPCDKLTYYLLDATGFVDSSKTYDLELVDGITPISGDMFDRDALVVADSQIAGAQLLDASGQVYVSMSCPNFPYFGIWSKGNLPFLCLEPWQSVTDIAGHDGNLEHKRGMNILPAGASHEYSYSMTF